MFLGPYSKCLIKRTVHALIRQLEAYICENLSKPVETDEKTRKHHHPFGPVAVAELFFLVFMVLAYIL